MVCERRKNISQVRRKLIRETDPNSLQYDRYACSVNRIEESRGVLMARPVTVGHVPFEISKICHYFILLLSMVVRYLEPMRTLNHENRPYHREA